MSDTRVDSLATWKTVALAAAVVIVLAVPLALLRGPHPRASAAGTIEAATFVGSDACRDCHRAAFDKWKGSDHERAMDVATDRTVLGDFNDAVIEHRGVRTRFFRQGAKFMVETEGPDGTPGTFAISHTFGVRPLQQYLVPFPGGRLQCLTIAWDTEQRRWFPLYPDQDIPAGDWLHWTRNAQNWNGMCAECHSTNLRKNYDASRDTFATTWSEISVGCEACHGPGSRHVAWAKLPPMARPTAPNAALVVRTSGISRAEQVELCAPCHSRRAELGDYDHSGRLLLDQMVPSLLTEALYEADGQQLDEVYTYQSFLQSKMFARGVGCADCHDSHSGALIKSGNALCLQCHQADVYDTSEHHFHKKTLEGTRGKGQGTDGGPQAGQAPASLCVKCHMVERPYMVVDWRADHSFRRPRPDLTERIGTPNACSQAGCHADKPLEWSLKAYRSWYGRAWLPHYGTTFAAARRNDPASADALRRLAGDALQPVIVRATALHYLQRFPGDATAQVLRTALTSSDPLLRYVATSASFEPDPARRVAALAPLLSDPVRAVRLEAVAALAGTPRDGLKPYQREAFTAGVREYEAAMSHALDFAGSGLNLGNLYGNLGDVAKAEAHYRLALKVDDLFFPAKMNLAVLLSGLGRNGEAETLLRQVTAAYPDNHDAAYSLGLLLVETGKAEEAVTWLRRAADGQPGNARVRYNLGLLLQQLGRLEEATPVLEGAAALAPRDGDLLFALGDHYLKRGRRADALAVAARLTALFPQDPAGAQLREAAGR